MGAKMRPDTTIGPWCKVGGEISNSVLHSYSNKAHDGFLGNSVLGAWCNLGADTNSSNLKNNYANVKIWSYEKEALVDSGMQFCGLIMGDHSKAGINTMFNTGTVVGVGCNIFGGGFPDTFIPSFSWGGPQQKWTEYEFDKMIETSRRVLARRGLALSETQIEAYRHIHAHTYRNRKRFFLL
jgi:UDP-N-acetylglucosamine diphosphorylase/glucosamine-1-phosphate N-acetyltransferase